jgi:SNF2 family DNA or RNA helicase
MEPAQRKTYKDFLAKIHSGLIKKMTLEGVARCRMEILEAILRLRQICCHPLLVTASESTPCEESAKLETLLQEIENVELEKRKAIIYSQFTGMLSLIGKKFQERGWKYAYLDGHTRNREKEVREFQENSDLRFFLISLKAGGTGLNLTAADYVYLYDPWWNDAVENQAIDRAHRIGRKEPVVAKKLIVSESIEEKMMKIKSLKKITSQELLDEEGLSAAAHLTEEDLRFLLNL